MIGTTGMVFRSTRLEQAGSLVVSQDKGGSEMTRALLLAVAVVVAALPAFGSGQPAKETPKELVVWHQADTPLTLKALELNIAEFEKKNPGIKVKYQLMDMQNMKQSMSTAVPSGLGPDIFGSSVGAYLWSVIEAGLLYDLTDAFAKNKWEQRLVPWSKPYTKYKGRYWSVPTRQSSSTSSTTTRTFSSRKACPSRRSGKI